MARSQRTRTGILGDYVVYYKRKSSRMAAFLYAPDRKKADCGQAGRGKSGENGLFVFGNEKRDVENGGMDE